MTLQITNKNIKQCFFISDHKMCLGRPREFLECVSHIRLLSWLLLGSLTHTALLAGPCTPVPQDASCHISDHIQTVMAGFAEQPKASVLHMSSLFHAFVLSQVRMTILVSF